MIAEESIKADIPVIIVDTAIPGISNFLASIQQEVTIIFDEFEKTFAKTEKDDPQVEMLSLISSIIFKNSPRKRVICQLGQMVKMPPSYGERTEFDSQSWHQFIVAAMFIIYMRKPRELNTCKCSA